MVEVSAEIKESHMFFESAEIMGDTFGCNQPAAEIDTLRKFGKFWMEFIF